METLPKVLQELQGEERELIFTAPVWISLFASYRHDGEIDKAEKAEAIKQAHFRTFTSPNSLHAYYKVVDDHFEDKFDAFNKMLPQGEEERDQLLEEKIRAIVKALKGLSDEHIAKNLMHDLNEFYLRVFRADSNIFQYFTFPLISKSLDEEDENLDEI